MLRCSKSTTFETDIDNTLVKCSGGMLSDIPYGSHFPTTRTTHVKSAVQFICYTRRKLLQVNIRCNYSTSQMSSVVLTHAYLNLAVILFNDVLRRT